MSYTVEEFEEFKLLVEMSESSNQIDRIESRLEMPKFIGKVSRQRCDEMFEFLK